MVGDSLPYGYAETMDKLKDRDNWDVPGVVADVSERLKSDNDGEALAVVESLLFLIRDIRGIARGVHHAFPSDRIKTIELMCDEVLT